ncbi:hypothetical protein TSAR_006856 [Trichomalopsis sarcophagae]|uniref:Uncharacterized protein n=1 Tax=Trichomalopsis sarcophagae TaxID=543379 RepID=A0A232F977_9HYME|nr:hypothetical protein TSAR_006856 [Trichomalopsis sarcophagae]
MSLRRRRRRSQPHLLGLFSFRHPTLSSSFFPSRNVKCFHPLQSLLSFTNHAMTLSKFSFAF